jgi:lysophospholipase
VQSHFSDSRLIFDFSSFIVGTSSTLFNQAFLQLSDSNSSSVITDAIQGVLGAIGSAENDVAVYPNPFYNWHAETSPIAGFRNLTLVDGGEANENVPFEPFLFSYRNVDAIFAFDNSADTTYSWPNGSSLHTTYQKAIDQAQAYNISLRMPPVPSTQGFVNGGYNTRPTFFGCNDSSLPTVIYVPNYPWSAWSNTSTYMLEYSTDQAVAIIENGRRTLDANGTDSSLPRCVTCAMMDNAVMENGGSRSAECEACFSRYCWDGTDNTTQSFDYAPVIGTVPAFFTNGTTAPSATPASSPASSAGAAASASSTSGSSMTVTVSMLSVILPIILALSLA